MKILQLHSDWVEFEPVKKEIERADEAEKKAYRYENIVVLLTAVEKGDNEAVGERAVDEIMEFTKTLRVNRVLIYPYAHISRDLAKPADALFVIRRMEEHAKEIGLEAYRAPFGWTKRFSISVKGHPLAEQSKSFSAEELKTKKKKEEPKKPSKAEEPKELSENDHRALGQKLDLYSFQEPAPGMVFYHPKGMIIRNGLINFSREERAKRNYREITTPVIMNKSLWETSGHWDHYKDNMFFTKIDDDDFAVKPMNCPGAILVFKSATRSYRELPLRLSEYGMIHRNELSGVLSGLFRIRQFVQDDAHIFVTEDQVEGEIESVVDIIDYFYKVFGFEYHVELSTKPDNALGSKAVWDKAEATLENALKKRKMKYKVNPKEGAFYGPKVDFHIKDSLGRTWQCATCQVDFQMPERFGVSYVGEDNKPHMPVIIHTVTYGSLERFIGILVEHFKGAFPLWLSPVQVRVLPLTDKNNGTAEAVLAKLKEACLRADSDTRSGTVEYRVREAELQKINYILVIGEKEEANKTVAVRTRGSKKIEFGVKLEDFVSRAKKEIEKKKQD